MDLSHDPSLIRTLDELGVAPAALLGHGGEAYVFAYGAEEVVRIHHAGVDYAGIEARSDLLDELRPHHERLPFTIPYVREVQLVAGRFVTFEPRLRGQALSEALREARGTRRSELLVGTLEASRALGRIPLKRPWFGDLCRTPPLRTSSWGEYLRQRARASLAVAGPAFAAVDVEALCAPFPEPRTPGLVHLDLYAGNVLVEGERVTALLDFGGVPVFGDPELDSLTVAVYLSGETTEATEEPDRRDCRDWLLHAGLIERLDAAERWTAAMWSFAVDNPRLQAWCRRVLVPE